MKTDILSIINNRKRDIVALESIIDQSSTVTLVLTGVIETLKLEISDLESLMSIYDSDSSVE
ncbi:hypothetical protein IGI42_002661 [Enterococcus sp. AZ109]